jgi:hypothetical protein
MFGENLAQIIDGVTQAGHERVFEAQTDKVQFEDHREATRQRSKAPMTTWITASDTSRRFS